MINSHGTPYDLETCKILVLGDSGVGKTSLTHLICYNEVLENSKWTIGATVDVKIHVHKEGTPLSKNYFMELWDIGGATAYQNNRHIFYHSFYGIILVYDLTNYKSYNNLAKWIDEILNSQQLFMPIDMIVESPINLNVPILVIATKADSPYAGQSFKGKRLTILDDLRAEEIKMDALIHPSDYTYLMGSLRPRKNKSILRMVLLNMKNVLGPKNPIKEVINSKSSSESHQQHFPTYPRNHYE